MHSRVSGKRRLLILPLAALLLAAAPPPSLPDLIADYERFTTRFPMEAGRSDPARGVDGWPQESLAAMTERKAGLVAMQARLRAVDATGLSADAAADRDYLGKLIAWRIEGLDFDERRFAFVAHEGFYNTPYNAARGVTVRDAAEARAWIAQLNAVPAYFAEQRVNMERGMATGWTNPASVVDVAVTILRNYIARPAAEDPLLDPIKAAKLDPTLLAEATKVIETVVRPAQREALAFIDGPYRAAARPGIGIASVPDGRAYYDFLLRYYTTTDQTAEQIHATGLAEVRRIRAEMDTVIKAAGFEGSFAEWLDFLRTDPRFYATSREQLLDRASIIAKRIDAVLPRYFGLLPRQPFAVVPVPRDVEEGYTTARYGGADFGKGFPGRFLVNTSHLDQRPFYELPALTLHEAAPGHHTHFALTSENPDLPAFRRQRDMLAYREGWALYAERLGHEMGIYRDPYETFGTLSTEMWRACRMVVDTGIHVMGWSYEQARACFVENTALADINIDTELLRYIGAPGGAVAYKVGELTIVGLRARAEQKLGKRFDIRGFHDLILAQGQVPMSTLEGLVDRWIAERAAAAD
ncbi:DUF885 domain-containing protein [Allosphingosinicella indica]|uniref:Uncharacterized conserved protein, DUF885 familyt n=1 Tax=Allosphingosinicella indica TaxID=941907 RepID=A0A1X7GE75_9SPHN|nr:DUF885 family protein [Allosphingosinicella indica]SMF67708.1 Uncharacterized conserved protein, DUF885 familyt [Allosphingosinicella indica]